MEIADNPAMDRYEMRVDGAPAGNLLYQLRPGVLALNHTGVFDRFEGEGLGSRLIAFALDDARQRGLAVLPFCPFVKDYIQRHPQYADLVPAEERARFGLA